MNRRSFIRTAACFAAGFYLYGGLPARASIERDRTVHLYNIHTGESLKTCYRSGGAYDPEAIGAINYLLRCHYTDEVKEIDIGVVDLLASITETLDIKRPVRIISGYRSAEYNDHLRKMGRKVARDSLHMKGLAIDFSVEGTATRLLSTVAKSFASGGVGLYPEFVHIDVGRVRYW